MDRRRTWGCIRFWSELLIIENEVLKELILNLCNFSQIYPEFISAPHKIYFHGSPPPSNFNSLSKHLKYNIGCFKLLLYCRAAQYTYCLVTKIIWQRIGGKSNRRIIGLIISEQSLSGYYSNLHNDICCPSVASFHKQFVENYLLLTKKYIFTKNKIKTIYSCLLIV